MTPAIRAELAALGNDLTPAMLGGTQKLMASMSRGMAAATKVTRDIAYGPDQRHRLDQPLRPAHRDLRRLHGRRHQRRQHSDARHRPCRSRRPRWA